MLVLSNQHFKKHTHTHTQKKKTTENDQKDEKQILTYEKLDKNKLGRSLKHCFMVFPTIVNEK